MYLLITVIASLLVGLVLVYLVLTVFDREPPAPGRTRGARRGAARGEGEMSDEPQDEPQDGVTGGHREQQERAQ
ncbi:hypothetical protein [Corynebacterium sp.]|uniref:hypothetical protein n=1 Tax=Corynebacterium sp. TaxID=1720 RepID=UPI0025C09A70|nr:hypothetical protein [Corynebacterium sp.]